MTADGCDPNITSCTHNVREEGWICSFIVLLLFGLIIVLSCTSMFSAEDSCADRFTADGITYETVSDTEVKITGSDKSISKEVVIPSSISNDKRTYAVISIGDHAFKNCARLSTITIPKCVTYIGRSAFEGCRSLTTVTISDNITFIGNYAFKNCTNLSTVAIPKCDTSVGKSVYEEYKSLIAETVSGGVTSISKYAFENCTSLTTVTADKYVKSIGIQAFNNCKSLSSIDIPDSITTIKKEAFWNCTSLVSVTFGNGVTSIGNGAFKNCSSLSYVTIPDSVTDISEFTFYGCRSLTSVTIGKGVTSIGYMAFTQCALTYLAIPKNVKSIDRTAFVGCNFYDIYGKNSVLPCNLSGYSYYGVSSSKLIRHEIHNVLFETNVIDTYAEGMDFNEGETFTLPDVTFTGRIPTDLMFMGWVYDGKLYLPRATAIKVSGIMIFTAEWSTIDFTADGTDHKTTSDFDFKAVGCCKSGYVSVPSSTGYTSRTTASHPSADLHSEDVNLFTSSPMTKSYPSVISRPTNADR